MKKLILLGLILLVVIIAGCTQQSVNQVTGGNQQTSILPSPKPSTVEESCINYIQERLNIKEKVSQIPISYRILETKSFNSVNDTLNYLSDQWLIKYSGYYGSNTLDLSYLCDSNKVILSIVEMEINTAKTKTPLFCDENGKIQNCSLYWLTDTVSSSCNPNFSERTYVYDRPCP
jgi:hypothetical protein